MNFSIVVALPRIEDAKRIGANLQKHGFSVCAVCNCAAKALSTISELENGLVITSYRLPDMVYRDIKDCLPKGFSLLVLTSAKTFQEMDPGTATLMMPLKMTDLVNKINSIISLNLPPKPEKKKVKARSFKDQGIILAAKEKLMEVNHMTEEEAYRYIQKCSMDSSTNMAETAEMLLMLL